MILELFMMVYVLTVRVETLHFPKEFLSIPLQTNINHEIIVRGL